MSGETRTDANGVIGTPVATSAPSAETLQDAARMLRATLAAFPSRDSLSKAAARRVEGAALAMDTVSQTIVCETN
jgi:hypothetical protein